MVRSGAMNANGAQLVERCLSGDDAAWERLVDEYRGLVYSICYLFCGSTEDGEDLVQDAFLKIWLNLRSFDPARGESKGWIATVARNQRVDRFRRTSQQRVTDSLDSAVTHEDSGKTAVTLAEKLADPRPTPLDVAVTSEVTAIVSGAVKKISPEMREVVTMRFVQGMD